MNIWDYLNWSDKKLGINKYAFTKVEQTNPLSRIICVLAGFKGHNLKDYHMTILFSKDLLNDEIKDLSKIIDKWHYIDFNRFSSGQVIKNAIFDKYDKFGKNNDIHVLKAKEKYFDDLRSLINKYNKSIFNYNPHITIDTNDILVSKNTKLEFIFDRICLTTNNYEVLKTWYLYDKIFY